jgi:inosine-uridine nucleoside N-ribohydrolase
MRQMIRQVPNSYMNQNDSRPVAVVTDCGRDVDDLCGLAYAVGSSRLNIACIATSHMIPDRRAMVARAFMQNFGLHTVRIGVGSIWPLNQADATLAGYLTDHAVDGRTYEGEGLIECFDPAEAVLHETIERYKRQLAIAALAPLTDLAKVALANPRAFSQIGSLHIQGQAKIEKGKLVPDYSSYNLAEDVEATEVVFSFQDYVPMTLVGKFTAYKLPLTVDDFDRFASTGSVNGQYLDTAARLGILCFAKRDPTTFRRVFGVPADEVSTLRELSKPYDVLAIRSIATMAQFTPETVDSRNSKHQHNLIGMTADTPGLIDPVSIKNDIVNGIVSALETSQR